MAEPEQIITLKDVYREVVALNGRMAAVDERQLQGERVDQDHEARLRGLERWRYTMPASIVVGLGSLGTALAAFLGRH